MPVLMELGIADLVPAFDAPALSDLSRQGFWAGAHAGEEHMSCLERLALAGAAGGHLNHSGT